MAMTMKKIPVYSNDYPKNLKEIFDPPATLYWRGEALKPDAVCVAIVGTRTPSRYGIKAAREIAGAVAERGGVVVSGLAFGIDSVCHRAAADLNKPTVAVIASGINDITPRSNAELAENILRAGGAVVSEFPKSESSMKYRFLRRNRIISGLCGATIVIEAGAISGALITARHAFEQNRDVYALIGDIDRAQGAGCRDLFLRDIAKPIFDIDRLMTDLKLNSFENISAGLDINAVTVLKTLKEILPPADGKSTPPAAARGVTNGLLSQKTGLPAPALNGALSILEINGLVTIDPSGRWRMKQSG